jgi:hypothetical protein
MRGFPTIPRLAGFVDSALLERLGLITKIGTMGSFDQFSSGKDESIAALTWDCHSMRHAWVV